MPTHRWGDFTPTGHLGRILDDRTPQLGGTLDGNGFNFNGAVGFEAKAGEALTHGDAVYVSGVSGNKPVVMKADADDAAKMPAFGIAENDASLNANVEVITFGTVYNIDTSGWQIGDELYVSTTPGVLTSIPPTGSTTKLQNIGKVIRSHASAGSIKVGGAGRTNAVPNLDDGTVFIGDINNQAEQRALVLADISDYTSPTETDPVYTASSWYSTTNNSSNWDTAYSWGDHSTQNYAVTTGDTFTGDITLASQDAKVSFGASGNGYGGPHGLDFYDSDGTLKWGVYYRTTPDTITWELSGTTAKMTLETDGTLTVDGTIEVDDVVLGGSGTIAGATWANGTFHLGDSTLGWAMDSNELYNSGTGIIGSLNGDLNLNPIGGNITMSRPLVSTGTITANRLDLTDSNLQLSQSGSQLRITTANGYGGLGPQNTSFFHFTTDRARYYFNKEVQVDGTGIRGYDTSTDCRFPIFYDLNDTGYYCDPASTSRLNVSYNDETSHVAASGKGVRFWNSDAYKIYMSAIVNSTWGGDVANSDSSDYAMYFRMTSGINRGFIFRNNTTNVAKIDGTGRATFSGLSSTGSYFDFTYNATGAGGIRMYDSGNVRQITLYGDGAGGGGILDNDGHWGYRQRTSTNATEIRCNNNNELLVYTSYVRAVGSMRSPIFYDFNNTTYYMDPSSTGTSIRCAGNIIAYYSDERLKNVEGNIENALDKVCSLNGFYYRANEKAQKLGYKDELQVGLSAQEVQKVLPEVIKDAPADSNYMTLDYAKTVPLLVEAIKELKAEIEELKAR